jgi:hypothetical protein
MLALGAGLFGATAMAQEPAVDQYSTTPPAATTTTVTGSQEGTETGTVAETTATTPTTTTPTGTTGGSGKPATTPGKPSGGSKPGNGNGNGNGKPTKTTGKTTGGGAADALGNRVALIQYGTAPKALRRDIVAALRQAGLQVKFNGNSSKARMEAFLATPMAKLLSTDGAEAVGQAFGAQLVQVTPVARRAFPKLFGRGVPFLPVIRAVLTRRDGLGDDEVAFQTGVTKGLASTDIPLAYVERSDRKTPSLVDAYRKLGVLTVDDIDTAAGKRRLGQIMLGMITTQKAVDAIDVKPASQQLTGSDDSSAGATPWAILAVLAAGAVLFMTGTLRRRGRGTA